MARLFGRNNDEEEDAGKAVEAKFTELGESIKKVTDNSVTKDEFKTVSDGVAAMLAEMNAAKETRRKAQEAAAAKAAESNTYDPEDAFNTFAADPEKAMRKATAGAEKTAALALSKSMRVDVLGNKEYYHGDFKKEVDNLIDTGTTDINALTNPTYLLNCYNLTYAKFAQEDKLGDMRRAAAHFGFSDGQGNGQRTEVDSKPKVEYRGQQNYSADKARHAAAQMGLTEEEIVKAANEGVINGLEVIA